MADQCYRVNSPDVLHETIDGEVVLVNMKSGNYYSIDKVGTVVWDLLAGGCAADQITEALTRRFDGDPDQIGASVRRLLGKFQDEQLVVTDPDGDGRRAPTPLSDVLPQAQRPPFEDPVLQKYTDMQQLLLLDPIHEVDETGWPSEKAPNAT